MARSMADDETMRLAEAAQSGRDVDQGRLAVKFEYKPVKNERKTAEEGRPIFDSVEFITIVVPGDKSNIVQRELSPDDKMRFPRQYMAFKANAEVTPTGTPLSEWPLMTTGQVEELRYFHVTTLEELAGLSDANAKNIGPIIHLRQKARDQIQRAKENAPSEQLRDALVERDNKISTLERQMQEVIACNKQLQDKLLAQVGVTAPSAQVEIPMPKQARR